MASMCLGDRALSKEDDIQAAASLQLLHDPDDEPGWLRVDLRLRLDEIVRIEADHLRSEPPAQPSARDLIALAGRIYEARRDRERVFRQKIFGEPAWDMLLALYYLPKRGELLSVTGLCHAAAVPPTTGLRYQAELTREGLIDRGPPGTDQRMQFMRLTSLVRELLAKYLRRLFNTGACHLPHPIRSG